MFYTFICSETKRLVIQIVVALTLQAEPEPLVDPNDSPWGHLERSEPADASSLDLKDMERNCNPTNSEDASYSRSANFKAAYEKKAAGAEQLR